MFFHHFWRNRIAVVEDIFSLIFCKKVSPPTDPTLTLQKQVFEARNSLKINHLDRRHQCKFIFYFFLWNFGKSFENVKFRNLPTEKRWFNILENRWIHENLGKSMKFSCFWQILEKSYCCRWRYFFIDFSREKSFTTCRSNFNPKKQVFEAWKSSKIDHLDGRHQCKFIFSFFSWNFGKSFKTLNFSNSYPQNDESKSCKIDEIHKELLKKHPFYIIFDTFLQKYKATATISF